MIASQNLVYNVYSKYFSSLEKAKQYVALLDSTGIVDDQIVIHEIELDNPKSNKRIFDTYSSNQKKWSSSKE